MPVITSFTNPGIKLYKSLMRRKTREETGLIPLEGIRLIEEACRCRGEFVAAFYGEGLRQDPRGEKLLQSLGERIPGAMIHQVSGSLLKKIADTETPQGILAVVERPRYNLPDLVQGKAPLVVVASGIQDPGNLGTMIRTASAAGASGVIITRGTVDVTNPKTLRATMGAIFQVPVVAARETGALVRFLRENRLDIVVTDLAGETNFYQVDYRYPTALVFGGEARGVEERLKKAARYRVMVPLRGAAESLNVAVTSGVVLYEALRQRHYGGKQGPGKA